VLLVVQLVVQTLHGQLDASLSGEDVASLLVLGVEILLWAIMLVLHMVMSSAIALITSSVQQELPSSVVGDHMDT
jgi:hypothetical protein